MDGFTLAFKLEVLAGDLHGTRAPTHFTVPMYVKQCQVLLTFLCDFFLCPFFVARNAAAGAQVSDVHTVDCSSLSVSQCPTDDNLGQGPVNMQVSVSVCLSSTSKSLCMILLCQSAGENFWSQHTVFPSREHGEKLMFPVSKKHRMSACVCQKQGTSNLEFAVCSALGQATSPKIQKPVGWILSLARQTRSWTEFLQPQLLLDRSTDL